MKDFDYYVGKLTQEETELLFRAVVLQLEVAKIAMLLQDEWKEDPEYLDELRDALQDEN